MKKCRGGTTHCTTADRPVIENTIEFTFCKHHAGKGPTTGTLFYDFVVKIFQFFLTTTFL